MLPIRLLLVIALSATMSCSTKDPGANTQTGIPTDGDADTDTDTDTDWTADSGTSTGSTTGVTTGSVTDSGTTCFYITGIAHANNGLGMGGITLGTSGTATTGPIGTGTTPTGTTGTTSPGTGSGTATGVGTGSGTATGVGTGTGGTTGTGTTGTGTGGSGATGGSGTPTGTGGSGSGSGGSGSGSGGSGSGSGGSGSGSGGSGSGSGGSGGGGSGSTVPCFTADVLVATPSGDRAIGTLRAGDQVLSVDVTTGKRVIRRIGRVHVSRSGSLASVRWADGELTGATASHPFYDPKSGGWVTPAQLKVGQRLELAGASGLRRTAAVTSITLTEGPEVEVFNLTLEGAGDTFFAGGVLAFGALAPVLAAV